MPAGHGFGGALALGGASGARDRVDRFGARRRGLRGDAHRPGRGGVSAVRGRQQNARGGADEAPFFGAREP